jgi:hypothetical protein
MLTSKVDQIVKRIGITLTSHVDPLFSVIGLITENKKGMQLHPLIVVSI